MAIDTQVHRMRLSYIIITRFVLWWSIYTQGFSPVQPYPNAASTLLSTLQWASGCWLLVCSTQQRMHMYLPYMAPSRHQCVVLHHHHPTIISPSTWTTRRATWDWTVIARLVKACMCVRNYVKSYRVVNDHIKRRHRRQRQPDPIRPVHLSSLASLRVLENDAPTETPAAAAKAGKYCQQQVQV